MFDLPQGAVLTRRDFVNTWDCDENDHWNVRFYARAFEQAAGVATMLGRGDASRDGLAGLVRHIRFHRELRFSRSVSVYTARIENQDDVLVHFLIDAESRTLCATALDHRRQPALAAIPSVEAAAASVALPRGVPAGADSPADTAGLLEREAAIISHLGIVRRAETDSGGKMLAEAIVARFSDGASHVWSHAGMGEEWLSRSGHGRVAVEMKLTVLHDACEGDGLRIVSWVGDIQEKTFAIRHQLESLSTGEVLALGNVRALIMNLHTRKAAMLPAEMREFFSARTAVG